MQRAYDCDLRNRVVLSQREAAELAGRERESARETTCGYGHMRLIINHQRRRRATSGLAQFY
jgi:hypothetical protein